MLKTVVTHENRDDRWGYNPPADLTPVLFGPGEDAVQQGRLKFVLHEWQKGGQIIRWIKRRNVRAVVICGYNDAGRVRLLSWCRRHRIACFISGDANVQIDHPKWLKRLFKHLVVGQIIKKATAVLPCGRNGEDFFTRYGARKENIFWFPYEPDFKEIQDLDQSVLVDVQKRFGLSPGRRRMVFSGRLIDWKHPELALSAFCEIADERPEWDLVFIGDGPMLESIRSRVPESLRSRIIFLGFLSEQRVISALYRCSDLLIHPADREQWALVVLEAVAAGMALVTDRTVGAAREFVLDHINGRTFPSANVAQIVECLREVTAPANIDTMKAESLNVLRDWQQHFDPVRGLRQALQHAGVLK